MNNQVIKSINCRDGFTITVSRCNQNDRLIEEISDEGVITNTKLFDDYTYDYLGNSDTQEMRDAVALDQAEIWAEVHDEEELRNDLCRITYRPNYRHKTDCFGGRDLTDQANDPAFYSETVRGHRKAWAEVKKQFNESTTFAEVINTLMSNGIRLHQWCMMD